jgi:hypothetical protein
MIPKTLLFFESKKIMRKCMYTIRTWLTEKNGYTWAQAADTVVEYHATLGEDDKARMYNEFKTQKSAESRPSQLASMF